MIRPARIQFFGQVLGVSVMKVFLAALVFAAVVAGGTAIFLNGIQQQSYSAFSTSGTRVGDPGKNLMVPG